MKTTHITNVTLLRKRENSKENAHKIAMRNFRVPIIYETARSYHIWESGTYFFDSTNDCKMHEIIMRGWTFCSLTKDYCENNTIHMLPPLNYIKHLLQKRPYFTRMYDANHMLPIDIVDELIKECKSYVLCGPTEKWNAIYISYLQDLFCILLETSKYLTSIEN
jgi:hypothetical protein